MQAAILHIFLDAASGAAATRQHAYIALLADDGWRKVACVGPTELPGVQIQYAKQQGHEHHVRIIFSQPLIDFVQHQRGVGFIFGGGSDQGSRDRHEERRWNPFVRDVANDEA